MKYRLLILSLLACIECFSQQAMFHADNKTAVTSTSIPVVTSAFIGSPRNDFSGWLGFKFTVQANPITITELGRWIKTGSTASHTIKIVDASNNTIVSATISTSGKPSDQFAYVSCT